MAARKLLTNASYFAFTATPKNKTLEMFGFAEPQPDGKVKHRPFHCYTMKQAIQERFILDVLKSYDLSDSMGYFSGKYLYETGWVAFEIGAVWKPHYWLPGDRDFGKAAGRWLAAWIRFWITDPDIWNRALDLAFDYFEAAAQAA